MRDDVFVRAMCDAEAAARSGEWASARDHYRKAGKRLLEGADKLPPEEQDVVLEECNGILELLLQMDAKARAAQDHL